MELQAGLAWVPKDIRHIYLLAYQYSANNVDSLPVLGTIDKGVRVSEIIKFTSYKNHHQLQLPALLGLLAGQSVLTCRLIPMINILIVWSHCKQVSSSCPDGRRRHWSEVGLTVKQESEREELLALQWK